MAQIKSEIYIDDTSGQRYVRQYLSGKDSVTGEPTEINISGGAAHATLATKLANEENAGTVNAYGTGLDKWKQIDFNPRAASIGTLVGAAGAAGATEVLIDAGVPILVGAIIFESDSAGNALLRDTGAVGNSIVANQIAGNTEMGMEFNTGLTICGTAAGTAFKLLYRAL